MLNIHGQVDPSYRYKMPKLETNWKKNNKTYFVNLSKVKIRDSCTPLHVILDISDLPDYDSFTQIVQNIELVRNLQKDAKRKNREVYLSCTSNESASNAYFKLPLNVKA